jgi:hypothetical protein
MEMVVLITNASVVEVCPGELSGMLDVCWYLESVETFPVLEDEVSSTDCEDDVLGFIGKSLLVVTYDE